MVPLKKMKNIHKVVSKKFGKNVYWGLKFKASGIVL